MGVSPAPAILRRRWDIIVHCAADTRWNTTDQEAQAANLHGTQALQELGPIGKLIHLSTSYVLGYMGDVNSPVRADYRNSYEWSKAAAERWVRSWKRQTIIVRFPIVIGRRFDGAVARFSGVHKLFRALASGILPAVVGFPEAYLDFVPVDDIANIVSELVDYKVTAAPTTISIAGGAGAPTVEEVLDAFVESLNKWRTARDIEEFKRPPLLEPERWDRFIFPFAREHLSAVQRKGIDVFSDFRPYLCMRDPLPATHVIGKVAPAIRSTVTYWADHFPRAAGAIQQPWR